VFSDNTALLPILRLCKDFDSQAGQILHSVANGSPPL